MTKCAAGVALVLLTTACHSIGPQPSTLPRGFEPPAQARDCVAYMQKVGDATVETPGIWHAPGAPSRRLQAYWFGAHLGARHAILTQAQVLRPPLSLAPVAEYTVVYQLPQDGCESSFLPDVTPRPKGWNAGHELTATELPAGSGDARSYVHDDVVARRSATVRARGGVPVTVLGYSADRKQLYLRAAQTLVIVTGAGTHASATAIATALRPLPRR